MRKLACCAVSKAISVSLALAWSLTLVLVEHRSSLVLFPWGFHLVPKSGANIWYPGGLGRIALHCEHPLEAWRANAKVSLDVAFCLAIDSSVLRAAGLMADPDRTKSLSDDQLDWGLIVSKLTPPTVERMELYTLLDPINLSALALEADGHVCWGVTALLGGDIPEDDLDLISELAGVATSVTAYGTKLIVGDLNF